ncbi:MAG TPA: hypothetical protein VLW86_12365 [Syntrophorhabdales bacterium]|nr:hypothetical protein [Syntrophorhabdales bacterium]
MRIRRVGSAELLRKPERLAEKGIELGPVEVEMLKVLLRDVAHTGRIRWETSRLVPKK